MISFYERLQLILPVAESLNVVRVTSTFLSMSLETLTQTNTDNPSSTLYELLCKDTSTAVNERKGLSWKFSVGITYNRHLK